ncbi:MAG: IS21-like element helper ATPase IstB [bacterium]
MISQQTVQALRRLKLIGMAKAYEQQLAQPESEDLSFDERFALLVDHESTVRDNRRLMRNTRLAKFRLQACLEDVDYRAHRGLQKSQIAGLASCQWITKHQNLCITGPTGTGKTFLACALGNQACRDGLTARYFRLPRLFETLRIAHGDGSYPRLALALAKVDLLILDDWGIQKVTGPERADLLELLEDRYGKRATCVTSQMPVKNWYDYLGDPTVADAILDRLIHNAHRVQLTGESMRKKGQNLDQETDKIYNGNYQH